MSFLSESMSSSDSPKFLSSLGASDLKSIEDAFYMNSKRSKNPFVSREDFGRLLSGVLTKGTTDDYYQLFDMVDISREGQIDWDRFSNYLLLGYYEREDRIKMSQVPQWQDIKNIYTPHKTSLCRFLLRKGHVNRYCTVSKDGLVCIMNEQCEVKRMCQISTNPEEIRSKDLWITDAAIMSNINKIAFATTSREIWIYDMSAKSDFVCQYKIIGMKHICLCMTYWSNKNNSNIALLAFGDTGGYVHAIFFSHTMSYLFEKPWKTEQSQDQCFTVNIDRVLEGDFPSATCLQFKAHSAWVRQITFIPLLDCFLTCSTTSTDSIVLAFLGKSRKDVRLTEFKIPLGINGFDYQESLNLIASAGINNHVCLWNPYVASKPVGVLRGHMQVIVAVEFMHAKNQLISFSKDKVLRIWDINLQICVQRLTGIFPKGPDVNILLFYDQEFGSLFSAFNSQVQVMHIKREVKHRIVSHDSPVTEVLYNEKFGHVISVDEGSCITLWFLNTGQKVKHITEAHGGAEITTVCLDHSQTRILTAGTDGNIKIWDINGNCHHVLIVQEGNPCEISQILYLKRTILAVGWSKTVCCFPTVQLKTYYVYPTDWNGKQEHVDDILAADFCAPRTLVTASYDGDIVFWNSNTQNPIRKITNSSKLKRNNRLPPLTPRVRSRLEKKTSKKSILKSSSKSPMLLKTPTRLSPLPPSPVNSPSPRAEEDSSFATITSIEFLKQRNANHPRCANLYSCHSDGHVRFWNSITCQMLGEFVAFEQFGSLVSCVDSQNKILSVGGDTGAVKLWNIESYLTAPEQQQPHYQANQKPLFLRQFVTHLDTVTCIKLLEKNKKLLIVTSSSDCSVALHTLDGLVGIFGQTEHWNINDFPTSSNSLTWPQNLQNNNSEVDEHFPETMKSPKKENVNGSSSTAKTVDVQDSIAEPLSDFNVEEELADDENAAIDINNWDNSALKKAVNAISNKNMTGRIQVMTTNSMRHVNKRKNNYSYRCLKTKQMDVVGDIEKPEFVLHPEKYFLEREDTDEDLNCRLDEQLETTDEELILKHDEKSIFPKYILDMDTKLRTANKILNCKTPNVSRSDYRGAGTKPKVLVRNSNLKGLPMDLSE